MNKLSKKTIKLLLKNNWARAQLKQYNHQVVLKKNNFFLCINNDIEKIEKINPRWVEITYIGDVKHLVNIQDGTVSILFTSCYEADGGWKLLKSFEEEHGFQWLNFSQGIKPLECHFFFNKDENWETTPVHKIMEKEHPEEKGGVQHMITKQQARKLAI